MFVIDQQIDLPANEDSHQSPTVTVDLSATKWRTFTNPWYILTNPIQTPQHYAKKILEALEINVNNAHTKEEKEKVIYYMQWECEKYAQSTWEAIISAKLVNSSEPDAAYEVKRYVRELIRSQLPVPTTLQ